MKKNYKPYFIFIILIITLFIFIPNSFASDPKLITTLNSSLKKIQGWILKLSTPAAAIAVGTGIFMEKFSFGEEQRILTGKRLVRTSLFSYAFILSIDMILSTINTLIK